MKKALIAVLALFIILIPALSFAAGVVGLDTNSQGLAPANSEGNPAGYDLCNLLGVANNIINFSVVLSIFVATVMFAYGGFLYVTAGAGGEAQIKKAHGVFLKVFFGIIIVLVAWLIVNIILSVLTGQNIGAWTQVACQGGGSLLER